MTLNAQITAIQHTDFKGNPTWHMGIATKESKEPMYIAIGERNYNKLLALWDDQISQHQKESGNTSDGIDDQHSTSTPKQGKK